MGTMPQPEQNPVTGQVKQPAGKLILLPAVLLLLSCAIWLAALPFQAVALAGDAWQEPIRGEWPDLALVPAKAWIVYDRATGETILEQQADLVLYPASTTKIMTAILVLENLALEQEITASEAAVQLPYGSSKLGLMAGETLQIRDLLAGLMLVSGNDAANVLAEAVDGSQEQFALRMNAKAAMLGMTSTRFCNPSGLHDDTHVSSARDLAILADYALENRFFRELAVMKTYVMPPTNRHPYLGWALLVNSNRLAFFDEQALGSERVSRYSGIKTGTTPYAGSCLVGLAELVDGRELISVVLGVPSQYSDGNAFSVTHALVEEAARIVLDRAAPVVTEPARPTESPAQTTPVVSAQPTPGLTVRPSGPSAPSGGPLPGPDSGEGRGLSAFLKADPWRTAFITLAFLLFTLCLVGYLQLARRTRHKSRKARVRPRRVRPEP